MFHANNSDCSKQENQINKSPKGKPNITVKSKLGSGDFTEGTDPAEKILTEMPEVQVGVPESVETVCQLCLPYLYSIRGSVADYQEKRGISRDEQYTFCNLLVQIGNNLFNSMSAMGAMLANLVPVFEAILLITRFVIDKLIDILESDDDSRMTKTSVFLIEAVPIFFIIAFIYGFVLLPLYMLFITVVSKVWHVVV